MLNRKLSLECREAFSVPKAGVTCSRPEAVRPVRPTPIALRGRLSNTLCKQALQHPLQTDFEKALQTPFANRCSKSLCKQHPLQLCRLSNTFRNYALQHPTWNVFKINNLRRRPSNTLCNGLLQCVLKTSFLGVQIDVVEGFRTHFVTGLLKTSLLESVQANIVGGLEIHFVTDLKTSFIESVQINFVCRQCSKTLCGRYLNRLCNRPSENILHRKCSNKLCL